MSTQKTPDLIRLYLKSCRLGFPLAFVFVGLLMGLDVFGLGRYVTDSPAGALTMIVLWAGTGVVFSALQLAITLLGFEDDDDDDRDGGHLARVFLAEPVPVRVDRRQPPRR